jgi:2-polyprenyl-3-methyl-5-hydroxy-6-metoxy-1,4-benzoquinol methylase
MMQNKCPLCKRLSAILWLEKFGRHIFRCSICNHIFVQWNEQILKQTRESYNNGVIFTKDGNESYYFENSNIRSLGLKLRWINKFCKINGTLLDVGSNFGHFLKIAQRQFKAQGIDISSYAVEWSRRNLGVNNAVASIEDLPPAYMGPYDVITMWDVIEHLPLWEKAFGNITKALKPKGLLFLTTPDSSSIIARLLGKHWYYLDPMQHFSLFSKKNLIRILENFGFEIVDMYYVGRYYKIKYILDRLSYLNSFGYIQAIINHIKKVSKFLENEIVYISMGDVVGICAQKKG